MEKQIILNEHLLIGKGYHRECYLHPENDSLCIKVMHNQDPKAIKQLKREIDYNLLLMKRKIPSGIIPEYCGQVDTNKGEGHVFALVKDYDGKISLDLTTYLSTEGFLENNFAKIVACLKDLKQKMLQYDIVTMNLYPGNILCQNLSENETRFSIIDDTGSSVFIPFEYYLSFAAKSRIERKWKVLISSIENDIKKPYIKELLTEIQ